jgi:hypothetical protein
VPRSTILTVNLTREQVIVSEFPQFLPSDISVSSDRQAAEALEDCSPTAALRGHRSLSSSSSCFLAFLSIGKLSRLFFLATIFPGRLHDDYDAHAGLFFSLSDKILLLWLLLQMDITSRFGNAVSYRTVRIPTLDIGRRYEILSAERISTRYGPSVLLTITVGPSDNASLPSDTLHPRLHGRLSGGPEFGTIALIYRGTCPQTHSYMLNLES